MKKALIIFLVLFSAILCPLSAMAAPHIVIDGRTIMGLPPVVVQSGSALVPMRGVFEHLGARVEWDGTDQSITAVGNGNRIVMTIGQTTAWLNGNAVTLSAPPQVTNGVTMVPLRVVGQALGANVKWDSKAQLIDITGPYNQKLTIKDSTFEQVFDSPYQWSGMFGQLTSIGGYLIIGSTNNELPKLGIVSQPPNTGILMLKINRSGELEWKKKYGDSGWNLARGLKTTGDGGFALAAYVPATQVAHQRAVIKFNKTGDQEWISVYDPSIIDIRQVAHTWDRGYITTAITQHNNPYVQKLDEKGRVQWNLTLDSKLSEESHLLYINQAEDSSYRLLFTRTDDVSIQTIDANGKARDEKNFSLQDILLAGASTTSDDGYILNGTIKQQDHSKGQPVILKVDSAGLSGNRFWTRRMTLSCQSVKHLMEDILRRAACSPLDRIRPADCS